VPAPPFGFLMGAHEMTLAEDFVTQTQRERSIPVLETKRLTLRAPRHEDVKAIAVLANDRRIAEIPLAFRILTARLTPSSSLRG
jgi:hypothetical protein